MIGARPESGETLEIERVKAGEAMIERDPPRQKIAILEAFDLLHGSSPFGPLAAAQKTIYFQNRVENACRILNAH